MILFRDFDELSKSFFMCKNLYMEKENNEEEWIKIPILNDYRDILKFIWEEENVPSKSNVSELPASVSTTVF